MSKFYSLKDYVHDMGLNMGEFKKLDAETQEKWRAGHQRKLKQLLKERDEAYDDFLFNHMFLPSKHVNPDTFESLEDWKKEEWYKQFNEWKKEQSKIKSISKESLETEDSINILMECGVPFNTDGPIGI